MWADDAAGEAALLAYEEDAADRVEAVVAPHLRAAVARPRSNWGWQTPWIW
jgi:hypothetical protein